MKFIQRGTQTRCVTECCPSAGAARPIDPSSPPQLGLSGATESEHPSRWIQGAPVIWGPRIHAALLVFVPPRRNAWKSYPDYGRGAASIRLRQGNQLQNIQSFLSCIGASFCVQPLAEYTSIILRAWPVLRLTGSAATKAIMADAASQGRSMAA